MQISVASLLNSPVTFIGLTQSHAQLKIRLLTHPV
jgi:hypothetical protein